MLWQLIRYVLLAAVRDRMIWGIIAISVLGACLSIFSGSAAIIEQSQFVVTYMAGGLRLLSLIGLVLFVVFFVRRSFDARDIEFLLTRPLSRRSFVLSHMTAFSILSVISGAFIALLVCVFTWKTGPHLGALMWATGVTIEYMIVANAAFFFAMVLGSPVTAGLSTLGFYVLARMTGSLLAIASHSATSGAHEAYHAAYFVTKVVATIVPRLDLMVQTSWLLYGGATWSDWIFSVTQGGVFLVLLGAATLVDLKRRQF